MGEVSDCRHYIPDDASVSSFVSQADDLLVPDVLRVSDSVRHDSYGGIHGSYGAVRVHNWAFRNVSVGPVAVDADDVETSTVGEWWPQGARRSAASCPPRKQSVSAGRRIARNP